jgi:hypothetical protein
MLPEECYAEFAKNFDSFYVSLIIQELKAQVEQRPKKYDVEKIRNMIQSIRIQYYAQLKDSGRAGLAWLQQEWPKAVENALMRTVIQPSPSPPQQQVRPRPVVSPFFTTTQTSPQEPTLAELRKRLQSLAKGWQCIQITDLPTNRPGIYNSVGNDAQTLNLRLFATIGLGDKMKDKNYDAQKEPSYWINLGRLVKMKREGRCFSCAGVAVYDLVLSEAWDDMEITVGGSGDFDHCFVKISRAKTSFALDIWQSNINKDYSYVYGWNNYLYTKGFKELCKFTPGERESHRSLAKKGGQ